MNSDSSDQLHAQTTLLVISGSGVPPWSARGLSQTFEPIGEAAQTRRTINGALKDLSVSQFRKYKSSITCTDQQPPAVSGIWPGQVVTVECVAELCHLTGGAFERPAVGGSIRTEGDFTFYRPELTMRVMTFTFTVDEYAASYNWKMDLEEI